MSDHGLTIGFLGCGKIGAAIATGFIGANKSHKIIVSRRSEQKSAELAAQFPNDVTVSDDNTEIVRLSDVIFIGLLPNVAKEILPQLNFANTKAIVSMMAAVNYTDTCALLSTADASKIVRTVPLPSSARRTGPILLYPIHDSNSNNLHSESLLGQVGTVVACKTEAEMLPLISITGHISSFFELMNCDQQFAAANGVDSKAAELFISSFYSSLGSYAALAMVNKHDSSYPMTEEKRSAVNFEEFADEAATPGGLNAQSLKFLRESTHYSTQRTSLDSILNRLAPK